MRQPLWKNRSLLEAQHRKQARFKAALKEELKPIAIQKNDPLLPPETDRAKQRALLKRSLFASPSDQLM